MIHSPKQLVHYDPETNEVLGFFTTEFPKNIKHPNVMISDADFYKFNEEQSTHVNVENGLFMGFYKVEVEETPEEYNDRMLSLRRQAYKKTDGLFMEWQFDETEESRVAWRDAVAAVKQNYPFK